VISEETRRCLYRGANLFNAQQFWEAHEAWEEAWQIEEGEVRLFLQGLIQVAAGLYKIEQNVPRGCVKLLTTALEKLRQVGRGLGGLDGDDLFPRVERCLAEAHRWAEGETPRFDRALIPRIRFVN
jgi:hypothetical protein